MFEATRKDRTGRWNEEVFSENSKSAVELAKSLSEKTVN